MNKNNKIQQAVLSLDTVEKKNFFFKKINSAEWIPELISKGYLHNAPFPIKMDDIQVHPFWVESAYLARISEMKPISDDSRKLIVDAVRNIKNNLNMMVIAHQLDVFRNINLQPDLAFFQELLIALKNYDNYFIPTYLLRSLCNLYKTHPSFIESEHILPILDELLVFEVDQKDFIGTSFSEIDTPRIDSYDFEILVENIVAPLIKKDPDQLPFFLKKLSDLMSSLHPKDKPKDASYIHIQDFDNPKYLTRIEGILALGIIEGAKYNPKECFRILCGFETQWSIIVRIELFLLLKYFDSIGEELFVIMNLSRLSTEIGLWFEYSHFLKQHFNKLSDPLKSEIIQKRKVYVATQDGESELLRFYQVIEDHLEGEHLLEYEKLSENGIIGRPHHHFYVETGWIGPVSPFDLDKFENSSIPEIVEMLCNFKPEASFKSPTPEGAARFLEIDVKSRADQYLSHVQEIKKLHPTYVRGILRGAENALSEITNINALLSLCGWVIEQDDKEVIFFEGIDVFEFDDSWQESRKRVASIVGMLLDNRQLAVECKDILWSIIEQLLNDPNPTIEHEETYGGENMDPFTLSINTVRGKAMHAFIKYLWWLNTQGLPVDDTDLIAMLNHHLTEDKNPSIRSAYGAFFASLDYLLPDWTQSNVSLIFPTDPGNSEYFEAAIEGFKYSQNHHLILKKYDFIYKHISELLQGKQTVSNRFNPKYYSDIAWCSILFFEVGFHDNCISKKIIKANNQDVNRIFVASLSKINQTNSEVLVQKKDLLLSIWEFFNESEPFMTKDSDIPPGRTVLSQFGSWYANQELFEIEEKNELLLQTLTKNPFLSKVDEVYEELLRVSQIDNMYLHAVGKIIEAFKPIKWDYYTDSRIKSTLSILHRLSANSETEPLSKDIRRDLIKRGYTQFAAPRKN